MNELFSSERELENTRRRHHHHRHHHRHHFFFLVPLLLLLLILFQLRVFSQGGCRLNPDPTLILLS